MILLSTLIENLSSPAILFFILGAGAGFLKSDLYVPENFGKYLALYLMMSIGFKGGVSVYELDNISGLFPLTVFCGILMSFFLPFIGYYLLSKTTKLDKPTSAALAAQYGSISIVTFATAVNFLKQNDIHYLGFMAAIVAIMEAPAIISGLYLAHKVAPETNKHKKEERILTREIFTNGAVLLILGSFTIGLITGKSGMEKVGGFLEAPFQGILCLFLLDMGLIVTKNLQSLASISWRVIIFGLYMPIVGATLGLFISKLIGLDIGSATLFITLCASSSYIAVPAAMKLALPEANSSIYMPISLAITFPLNVIFGIPVYFAMAEWFLG